MKATLLFLLFLLVHSFSASAQSRKLTGQVQLVDIENKDTVIAHTLVILTYKTFSDSVSLGSDLSFTFDHLPDDTFYISFSRPSYPYSTRFRFYPNDEADKKIIIPYQSTCPFDKTKNGICPVCKQQDEVIPIRYGLLAGKINKHQKQGNDKNQKPAKRTFYPGGCMVSPCQASWYCERDRKEF